MAQPTFLYFGFAGRALAARVALFNVFGKSGWKDERLRPSQFKKLKEQSAEHWTKGTAAPMISENLPQLTLPDGTQVTQSTAIARWAALQTPAAGNTPAHYVPHLYPRHPDEAIIVDETMAIVDQIIAFTPKDSDKEALKAKRIEYSTRGFMNVGMRIIESRIARSGGPLLLGDRLTLADLYIKCPLSDLILDGLFDYVEPSFLQEHFPLIHANHASVKAHPLLQAYYGQYKS